jgi:Ca-activated chloride channel family protein
LDEKTLKKVAKTTGGLYFRATSHKSLQNIYQSIDAMAKVSQEQKTIRPQYEYYPWFLAIGFFLFLYLIFVTSGINLHTRRENAR